MNFEESPVYFRKNISNSDLYDNSFISILPRRIFCTFYIVSTGIECGEVGGVLAPHLKVIVISREVGGRAVFSCEAGFSIKGSSETVCQASGDWAAPFPTCEGQFDVVHNDLSFCVLLHYLLILHDVCLLIFKFCR